MRIGFWRAKYTAAEALAAAWADIDEKSLVNLLENSDFEVGDPPVGWSAARVTLASESTIVKIGSRSLKITGTEEGSQYAYQSIANYSRYGGRKVTVGCWLYTLATNEGLCRPSIEDDAGATYGTQIAKDSAWHWATVTREVTAAPTYIVVYLHSATAIGDISYASGAILVEGDSCPAFSPKPDQSLICHHTAAYTISRYETGHVVHTNLGAGGAVTITLPQVVSAGFVCHFAVMVAQELRIDPGAAGAIYINGAKQTDDKYIWADAIGESVDLVADGNGDWIARNMVGTWGVEA